MLSAKYLERSYWDVPPRADHGDSDDDQLYRAVGYALSQWEGLEIALSGLFAVLVESKSQAATRAYGALASARARVEALASAAEVFFATEISSHFDTFQAILKVVGWAGSRRNDIAHGIVLTYARHDTVGGGFFLVAPHYNSRKTDAFVDVTLDSIGDPFAYASHGTPTRARKSWILVRASSSLVVRLRIWHGP
jgi:hypothetical protein